MKTAEAAQYCEDARSAEAKRRPLVTAAITCFNASETIKQAIASAQSQTWENLEILIVDDGSKDYSIRVIEKCITSDKRIRLVRHERNMGTAAARNTLANEARGEYIVFFDDDDISDSQRVEKQWQRLCEYEKQYGTDFVFCYTNRYVCKPGEDGPDHIGYAVGRSSPEPSGEEVADLLLWHSGGSDPTVGRTGQMGSCTLMLKRSVFGRVGFFDPVFRRCAEWDLAIRAALRGAHFIAVDEPLVTQRKTPTSDKAGRKPLEYLLLLRRKHRNYLKAKGVYLASFAIAHSRFHGSKRRRLRSRMYLAIACLLSPRRVLTDRMYHYTRRLWMG